jgi:segregation and condensation protein A
MDYRVELDIYNGPLDLLLYLIKRDELDIYDIPIARITKSYMTYVNLLRDMSKEHGLDINVAGDFLVMAATLMEIKSAMLLPKPPPDPNAPPGATAEELTDPRYELVHKLLEYKRFKDAASALAQQQETHQQRFARVPAKPDGSPDEPPPIDLEEVQIWDLLSAFQRLMAEVGQRKPRDHEVIYDDTPIDLHAADIEDRLKREGRLTLRQLFEGRQSRSEMIGVFLALLELVRERKILIHVGDNPNDLQIDPAPESHRKGEIPLHLAEEKQPEPAPGAQPVQTEEPSHEPQ